ncbi:outer membrane protein [Helicobacter cetorum]|uniref:Putative outer membrane protein n=1 Tax=Helicobacter cetorum (strain ATCC BAA-429 / MIT 00-7128) TaxID=182217 RepID=I0EL30_HELC0|nr:outer membrane protein [Helicobacter cetorum]AFI03649.1 putative outer membrane protein [Helicobacter cetorum MIT 00-7128]
MKFIKFVSVVGSVALIGSVGMLDAKTKAQTQAQKNEKVYTADKASATNALKTTDYQALSGATLTKDKKADKTDTDALQTDASTIVKDAKKVTDDLANMKKDEANKTKFNADKTAFATDLGNLKSTESDYTAKEKLIAKAVAKADTPPTPAAVTQAQKDETNLAKEETAVSQATTTNTNATTDGVLNQDLKTLTTDTATEQTEYNSATKASDKSADLTQLKADETKVASDTKALDTALKDSQYKGAVPALQKAQTQKSAYDNGTGASGAVTPTTTEGKAIKAAEGLKTSSTIVSGDLTQLGKDISAVNTASSKLQSDISAVPAPIVSKGKTTNKDAIATAKEQVAKEVTALQQAEATVSTDESNLNEDSSIAAAQKALTTLQGSVTSSTHVKSDTNVTSSWTTLGELTSTKGNTAIATTLTNATSVKTDSSVQTDVQSLTTDETAVNSALTALENALKNEKKAPAPTKSKTAPKTEKTASDTTKGAKGSVASGAKDNTKKVVAESGKDKEKPAVKKDEVAKAPKDDKKGAEVAQHDKSRAIAITETAEQPKLSVSSLEQTFENDVTALQGAENTLSTAVGTAEVNEASSALTDLQKALSTGSDAQNPLALASSVEAIKTAIKGLNTATTNISADLTSAQNFLTNHYVQKDLGVVKTDEASATQALNNVESALKAQNESESKSKTAEKSHAETKAIILAAQSESSSTLTTDETKLTSAEKALSTSEQTLSQDLTLAKDYQTIDSLIKEYASSFSGLKTEFAKFSADKDGGAVKNKGVATAYTNLSNAMTAIENALNGTGKDNGLDSAIAKLKSYKNGGTAASATKFGTQKASLATMMTELQKNEANFQNLVKALEQAKANSITLGGTNYTLGSTDFTTNNTAQNLSNMQTNLKTLQGSLGTLNYANDHAVMSALSNALAIVTTANDDLKNPQVNVSTLNHQMTEAKEAIANVVSEINAAIKTAGANSDEATNLGNALKIVSNASAIVSQAKSNVVAVAAQKGILPQVALPATSTQSVSGSAYGVDVQIGYKYFFGKTKHWGIRGYATYAYMQSNLGHTTNIQGAGLGVGQANNHTYGAGFDFLYNFHESQDGIHTAGILLGTELLGSTWVNQGQSIWHARMEEIKALGGKASMNTSYFQIPLVVGFRSNFSKHSGIELGLKIPLVVNYYFRSNYDGFEQSTFYKNNIKLYFNYVVNF